jgi:hypothetical protein
MTDDDLLASLHRRPRSPLGLRPCSVLDCDPRVSSGGLPRVLPPAQLVLRRGPSPRSSSATRPTGRGARWRAGLRSPDTVESME